MDITFDGSVTPQPSHFRSLAIDVIAISFALGQIVFDVLLRQHAGTVADVFVHLAMMGLCMPFIFLHTTGRWNGRYSKAISVVMCCVVFISFWISFGIFGMR